MESLDRSPNTTRVYANLKLDCLIAIVAALNSNWDLETLRYKHG